MSAEKLRPVFAALLVAAATLAVGPMADAAGPQAGPQAGVRAVTESVAEELAVGLADASLRARLVREVLRGEVDLADAALPGRLATGVADANRALLSAKGLPAGSVDLLRLRLGHEDMAGALDKGAVPLVAAVPGDDRAESVIAYDTDGRSHVLSTARVPARPVLLVDLDVSAGLAAGMEVLRTTLAARGVHHRPDVVGAAGGYWATQIADVRLSDDEEPWVKGDAEVYALVAGFGHDGKVRVDPVDMPYLNNDGTTYYPNQVLVHWNGYKYDFADAVMMEDDGGTNYKALALAVANALLTIIDGGAYAPLVTAILEALPDDWYTDDPDYVDSWYTLSTQSSGTLNGASGNGRMTLRPHYINEL
jgi:hypothetical protein